MVDDILTVSKCGVDSLAMNTFINTKIELKKLKFHTPDEDGRSKCHKMHVGTKKLTCPQLKVHGAKVEDVTRDDYLGDIICADGSNKENIQKRIGRGFGIISEIINILSQFSYGYHYYEIALLLRPSLFLKEITR